ncbi:spore germination protein [Caldinitratiruptor microaerophilus]|uniref:Spore germination protein n=1 Tax=Caldinitratiruptor microaerophilus TaxID=671077 RepID=A0AA35G782_9FIRM|nr:spore germination protein [Caldinitratiruptor microaerophilus]BDG59826.1 spore germination protein [Caldinitratiruptor microaerophilus]
MRDRVALTGDLDRDVQALKHLIPADDLQDRRLVLGRGRGPEAALLYIEGLADPQVLNRDILGPLLGGLAGQSEGPAGAAAGAVTAAEAIARQCTSVSRIQASADPGRLAGALLDGEAVLLVGGSRTGAALQAAGGPDRPVEPPGVEASLRGPRDAFVESLVNNVALVRRRIRDRSLRVRILRVGRRSRTRVALLYLGDVARPELVREVRHRLETIDFDGILDAHQLAEMLGHEGRSPFPRVEKTERPDRTAAALFEGRVAVLVDVSPFALLVPVILLDSFQAPDDYYTLPALTAFVRIVRLLGWAVVTYLPALYVAVAQYNPDLVRTELTLFMQADRTGIPLTPVVEVIFLEFTMEMIHESLIRLPEKVGSAATIVGGLIIGQAAVQARLISSVVVIVVASSAIGSFTFPNAEMGLSWRLVKWLNIGAAALFGLHGLFIASLCLLAYLNSIDSFGAPYLAPISPHLPRDAARDTLHRMHWGRLRWRGSVFRPTDPDRAPRSVAQQQGLTPTSAPPGRLGPKGRGSP